MRSRYRYEFETKRVAGEKEVLNFNQLTTFNCCTTFIKISSGNICEIFPFKVIVIDFLKIPLSKQESSTVFCVFEGRY